MLPGYMRMFWSCLGHLVRISYFIRFPLLTLVLLALFGFIATRWARTLLASLLDLDGKWRGLALVTMTALLCAAAAVTSINVTARYGVQRFNLPPAPAGFSNLVQR